MANKFVTFITKNSFFKKIRNFFRTEMFKIGLVFEVANATFPIILTALGIGNRIANIVVSAISILYLFFYIITYFVDNSQLNKSKKTVKKATNLTKDTLKHAIVFGANIYTAIVALSGEKPQIFLAVVSILFVAVYFTKLILDSIKIVAEIRKARQAKIKAKEKEKRKKQQQEQIEKMQDGFNTLLDTSKKRATEFVAKLGEKKPKVLPPEGEEKPKFSLFGKKKQELQAPTDGEQDIEITVNEVRELPAPEEKKKRTPLAAIGSFVGGVRNKFTKKALPEPTETDENTDVAETPETV